jgi:hypothetical protein
MRVNADLGASPVAAVVRRPGQFSTQVAAVSMESGDPDHDVAVRAREGEKVRRRPGKGRASAASGGGGVTGRWTLGDDKVRPLLQRRPGRKAPRPDDVGPLGRELGERVEGGQAGVYHPRRPCDLRAYRLPLAGAAGKDERVSVQLRDERRFRRRRRRRDRHQREGDHGESRSPLGDESPRLPPPLTTQSDMDQQPR